MLERLFSVEYQLLVARAQAKPPGSPCLALKQVVSTCHAALITSTFTLHRSAVAQRRTLQTRMDAATPSTCSEQPRAGPRLTLMWMHSHPPTQAGAACVWGRRAPAPIRPPQGLHAQAAQLLEQKKKKKEKKRSVHRALLLRASRPQQAAAQQAAIRSCQALQHTRRWQPLQDLPCTLRPAHPPKSMSARVNRSQKLRLNLRRRARLCCQAGRSAASGHGSAALLRPLVRCWAHPAVSAPGPPASCEGLRLLGSRPEAPRDGNSCPGPHRAHAERIPALASAPHPAAPRLRMPRPQGQQANPHRVLAAEPHRLHSPARRPAPRRRSAPNQASGSARAGTARPARPARAPGRACAPNLARRPPPAPTR